MHSAAVHIVPILAAEKSKTAYYIFGGALAAWAFLLALGLGLRVPDFPRNLVGQRAVMGISIFLVLGTMASAVLTSGVPASAGGVKGVTSSESAKPAGNAPSALGTSPQGGATASTLALTADPSGQLRFDKQTLKAPAGKVSIGFSNASPVAHNVTDADQSGAVVGATPTKLGSATLNLNLKPGSYVFYCSVPGHRQAGMQGTLTVS